MGGGGRGGRAGARAGGGLEGGGGGGRGGGGGWVQILEDMIRMNWVMEKNLKDYFIYNLCLFVCPGTPGPICLKYFDWGIQKNPWNVLSFVLRF